MTRVTVLAILSSILLPWTSGAAPSATTSPAPPAVTLEKIMADPDWIGRGPESYYWADDAGSIYYQRKVEGSEERKLYQADLEAGTVRVVEDAERGAIDVDGGSYSPDRTFKVYSREGDIYVKELASGFIRQLTRTVAAESDPLFMADGSSVAFRRDDVFFLRRLADGLEVQLADVRLEKDPREEDEPTFLEAQQVRLFEVVRSRRDEREAAEERERAEQQADPTRPPLPFYLGGEVEIVTRSLSPGGRWLLLGTVPKQSDEGTRTPMPLWVTESGDVETRTVRPKVGAAEPVTESLVLLDLESHARHSLDVSALPGIFDDPLAELRRAAEARESSAEETGAGGGDEAGRSERRRGRRKQAKDDEPAEEEARQPREIEIWGAEWSGDGRHLVLMLGSLDNKDRWLAAVDFDRMALDAVHRLHDPAWVNYRHNDFGWLADDTTLYFLSEESGYSNLYTVDVAGRGEPSRLVGGPFVVAEPQPTPDGRTIYFAASETHPGITEIHRVDVERGTNEAVTALGGVNSARLSPDGSRLLVEHSTAVHPPELWVQESQPGAEARRVTHTVSDAFLAVDWTAPRIVEVPSTHVDRPIYSRLYLPPDGATAPGDRRPAVVFVHGAGYLQNAHHGWSSYFREFMFHTLLTRRGYVVLDMDYRASAGYGREWRTAIYRQMGTPELEDLEDGVAWLVEHHDVDPRRVGVYGGSYGGFMTLMALFKRPQLFAAGAALRPVTDWAHYNHPYTSNILNTPEIDPEAYARSSPIEFAEGLARPLLLCAPMLDDNVLFQDTVRLVQRLIELEKTDFETAIFPVEPHGFREPSSWLDEYRRILALFEDHVRPARPWRGAAEAGYSDRRRARARSRR